MIVWINSIAGDPKDKAFMLWLYEEFKPLMFATAQKYVSNISDCEDIVQDSLERLMRKISLLRSKERCVLASYIVFTIRNASINHLKKQALRQKHFVSLEEQREEPLSPAPPLDEWMALAERKTWLRDIWDQLSQEEHLLLAGKYILNCSDAELAAQLGCKPASIRMKLTRARRKALQFMEEREGDAI